MKIDPRIGQRLRRAREAAELTQCQLADLIGSQQTTIVKWETGKRSISVTWAEKISKALHLNLLEMLPTNIARTLVCATDKSGQSSEVASDRAPVLLPMYAVDAGTQHRSSIPFGYAPVPHYLCGVSEPYALLSSSVDMTPRYAPGQLLFVDPSRQPCAGAGVVVDLTDGSTNIREWCHSDENGTHLFKLNNLSRSVELVPHDQIRAVHVVVGVHEVL